VTVRSVRPEDWRVWRDLRWRALADAPDAFGQTLAESQGHDEAWWKANALEQPGRTLLLAEREGAAVGMAVGALAAEPRTANLFAMWVAPEARRLGVARDLVAAVKRWAGLAGASQLELRVAESNTSAVAVYVAEGFADTGRREPIRTGATEPSRILVARLGPLVMGVVNVTPDSFSDGGVFLDPATAIAHGRALVAEGADILDIGGEATNPRAAPVDAAEELRRILPVIEGLAAAGCRVSVDTTKAEVARAAVAAGATIVNDVSGGAFDPAMFDTIGELAGVTYVLGHLRGGSIAEVFAAERAVTWREVADELGERFAALPTGARARTWVDPGLGFGKGADPETNLELIRRTDDLGRALGCPVVVGPSRKRFLRRLIAVPPGASPAAELAALDGASVAACLGAARAGAHVVRVHNVALLRAALAVYTKL
jgi:dihydropteroate synthase